MPARRFPLTLWMPSLLVLLLGGVLSTSAGRGLVLHWFDSLRMQKAQAVNVDFSPFSDPNANPALHQMVSQMVSDHVNVAVNDPNKPAPDRAAASADAGFPVQLLSSRKDAPTLIVGGRHQLNMTVDLPRLQEILKAAGHPEITLPQSLDGAAFTVNIPPTLHAQYGNCPRPQSAGGAVAGQVIENSPSASQYSDCVRLTEGPTPVVNVPAGLDIQRLAEIGLQAAGMSTAQADSFFQATDWRAMLLVSVPRQLHSYQQVAVNGARATLLSTAARRGPGYALIWNSNGMSYALSGFGDSSTAVPLAESLR